MDRHDLQGSEHGDTPPLHYYGNVVRGCLILASLLMMGAVLVDWGLASFYLTVGVMGIVMLVVLAGLTSPKTTRVLQAEVVVSGLAFLFFEYAAVSAFGSMNSFSDPIFMVRQALAVLFLVALYYSIKSLRGLNQKDTSAS